MYETDCARVLLTAVLGEEDTAGLPSTVVLLWTHKLSRLVAGNDVRNATASISQDVNPTARRRDSHAPQNPANPTFLDPTTNTEFNKYAIDTGDASEAEMIAIEYICSYNPDEDGETWLVSEEGNPVIKLTSDYFDNFGGISEKIPSTETYSFSPEYFQAKLSLVRADPLLQKEAQKWSDDVKAARLAQLSTH
ncbi:uncharacterized protein N7498_000697 [Penicillium cinerascens]|uniref:Uncharacterized protein n=1 Tax=Penicillium cinerascens TaxID=70096 RepID=A0A9W9TDC9_9EURO|nr:uncharacterized protein N7498_000697 [Penicillium cinerascens]KAJ5218598.1 hypothetical protein N7498_000697 [Penicillium cinerascens]